MLGPTASAFRPSMSRELQVINEHMQLVEQHSEASLAVLHAHAREVRIFGRPCRDIGSMTGSWADRGIRLQII